ncbi:hypothetical protein A2V49_01100 [candidate division WWE3 bacterium RBG_19FT_COMBO_34_6]|uniref:Uncharacterized protein n=1 Tax=candidate division WWE3 bacterium RBG_19FT_COMBO_34_6 TaxID=1802612 RepID=A0A1F4UMX8_UNCKA|nr:MAG: hypothetical protein A2V49_01100 [candidate division WWE3 bacterium RBG_19FT_COMBO_34_6]
MNTGRLILKLTVIVIIFSLIIPATVTAQNYINNPSITDIRSEITSRAISLAIRDIPGEYSWMEYRNCSSIIGKYLKHLSFPVEGLSGEYKSHEDPFPCNAASKQVDWISRNYPEYLSNASVKDFLYGELLKEIKPGDIIYLELPFGNKVDATYYETVLLEGYNESGAPIFIKISAENGKIGVSTAFNQLVSLYSHLDDTVYATWQSTINNLTVTWFDPLAVINKGNMWKRSGKVTPNSSVLNIYDYVLTVNIYDGTTTLFEKIAYIDEYSAVYWNKYWEVVTLGGYDESYAITGLQLPANYRIGTYFYDFFDDRIYDSDYGVYISKYGVYQHSWTPQMLGTIEGITYLYGFGRLLGSTDISVISPMFYDKNGELIKEYRHSDFTVHKIPDVLNYDMLLREDLLLVANTYDRGEIRGPVPFPRGSISSGCINYDKITWSYLSSYIKEILASGKRVGVILSYPGFEQSLLPTLRMFEAPFTGASFNKWCPQPETLCDSIDRRIYLTGYLDR